jgi:hypothetical protein
VLSIPGCPGCRERINAPTAKPIKRPERANKVKAVKTIVCDRAPRLLAGKVFGLNVGPGGDTSCCMGNNRSLLLVDAYFCS